jgi:hypothetical protein
MKPIYLRFIILFSITQGFGQTQDADTAFVKLAANETVQRYQKAMAPQLKLYNGSRYVAPPHSLEQHPYFSSDDWIMGSVFYDGESFRNVPLMYNILSGELITEHYTSGHPIRLIFEKLRHFSIAAHHFEKMDNTSGLPSVGFYDVLYEGTTRVLAKRQKILREHFTNIEIEISFDEKARYFILKNGVYFTVSSKASIFKILADEKKQLKNFLRENRIIFSDNKELAIKRLAVHYDTLKTKAPL